MYFLLSIHVTFHSKSNQTQSQKWSLLDKDWGVDNMLAGQPHCIHCGQWWISKEQRWNNDWLCRNWGTLRKTCPMTALALNASLWSKKLAFNHLHSILLSLLVRLGYACFICKGGGKKLEGALHTNSALCGLSFNFTTCWPRMSVYSHLMTFRFIYSIVTYTNCHWIWILFKVTGSNTNHSNLSTASVVCQGCWYEIELENRRW